MSRQKCCLVALLVCATCFPPLASLAQTTPAAGSAVLADTAKGGGRDGAAFFMVEEINGTPVKATILSASRAASAGRGPDLRVTPVFRTAPAGKTKLKIAARFGFAAPIQTLFSSRSDYAVTGELEVELRADARYRVNGNLDAFRREVWLEEDPSGAMIGQKFIDAERSPEIQKAMASASFTCCNLHYEGDWISDTNATTLPMIPAGTPIVVRDYGSNRAAVLIDGRPLRVGHDYGRKQESLQQYVAKLLVKDDPKSKISGYPPNVQQAISKGRVALGMTREQVIIALGYPRTDATPSLDGAEWKYWTADDDEFVVAWDGDGRVKEVRAAQKVRALVVHAEQ